MYSWNSSPSVQCTLQCWRTATLHQRTLRETAEATDVTPMRPAHWHDLDRYSGVQDPLFSARVVCDSDSPEALCAWLVVHLSFWRSYVHLLHVIVPL